MELARREGDVQEVGRGSGEVAKKDGGLARNVAVERRFDEGYGVEAERGVEMSTCGLGDESDLFSGKRVCRMGVGGDKGGRHIEAEGVGLDRNVD